MTSPVNGDGRYRELAECSPDIIAHLLPDGTILFISAAVGRVTARSPRDLIGRNFRCLVCCGDHGAFDGFLARAERGEENPRATVRLESSAHEPGWLELSGRALGGPESAAGGIVCSARDITRRKSVERALRNACRQAKREGAARSEFLRYVSHEFRTPLTAILGFSELIRDETFGEIGDRRYAEYAQIIHESSSLLKVLINNLLDLSKIDAGRYGLRLEDVSLKDVVPLCVRQITPQAMKKKIVIRDGMSDAGFRLQADRLALMQILINLLSNAVEFTPEKGRVDLRACLTEGRIWLHVSDTGIGIRKQDVHRITRAFEQVRHGPHAARAGTGLGLALVKSLARLHRGDLVIESEPGAGTVCSVVLPARDGGPAERGPASARGNGSAAQPALPAD